MSFSIANPQEISQLDPGGTLKNVHDYNGQSFRVRDTVAAVQDYFSHYRAIYDGNDNPTKIEYFLGTQPHITEVGVSSDVGGSLNNTYFFVEDTISDKLFYVWYNVSGSGVDPNIPNATGIQVDIATNDDSAFVALATELFINSEAGLFFDARRKGNIVKVTTKRAGVADDSVDGTTGFMFTNTQGAEKLVETVCIDYNGSNPVWEGQELKGYQYNIFTGKFELVISGGNVNVDFDQVAGSDPTIVNLTTAVAGTETSFALPQNVNRFMVRARNSARLQFSFTNGQSATNFITIPRGTNYTDEGLKLNSSQTVYIQAPNKNNVDIEVIYWI